MITFELMLIFLDIYSRTKTFMKTCSLRHSLAYRLLQQTIGLKERTNLYVSGHLFNVAACLYCLFQILALIMIMVIKFAAAEDKPESSEEARKGN